MLKPVTILVRYTNEEGDQELRFLGFLTGSEHGMYVDPGYGNLHFCKLESTDDPTAYLDVGGYLVLGKLSESEQVDFAVTIIEQLASKLQSISGYEFLMNVIANLSPNIELEDWIIPELLNKN